MAYELLTGRTPFVAATPQAVLAAHVTMAPDSVRKYRPQISAELDAVVMKCLAKRPADRWQSAGEMIPFLDAAITPSGGLTPTNTQPIPATAIASSRSGSRRTMSIAIGAIVIAAAGIGGWKLLAGSGAVAATRIEQIAILPLMDLSHQDTTFASTLHDVLILAIARDVSVGVISRTGVLRISSSDATSQQIAKLLGVQAVMEGTIFRAGDKMRINVQLVEPTTLRYLWNGSYERDVKDVLGAQDEVVRTIAGELGKALALRDGKQQ